MLLPITLATAGGAGLINLWLAIRTGMVRRPAGVMIGDGGNALLQARMRAHANFVEYAPFVLLLIALIEFAAGSSTWLWVVSAVFLLGRLAHPLGMEAKGGGGIGRMIGFATTALILLGLSLYAVALPFTASAAPVVLTLG
ncbi:MAPEG family protein [Sphingomonas immobilis]|uniref:MAPEG family protein n=1 Tax=Sphingomonas immobilis TaxID=3063997 RepID=A0ABT8ZY09_9SPHN|nr:MAPEG family protein [Sphingomonas sp. CA1-15]MDO7841656.1 MAPEG family protein [Sphingomonas sp. CA1-15]